MKHEVQRKVAHTVLALVCAFALGRFGFLAVVSGAVVLLLLFLMTRFWLQVPILTSLFRSTYGELFFVLGILASLFLAYPTVQPFQIAMVLLGLADTSASLVGMVLGTTHTYEVFGEKRSVHGSLACVGVSLGVLFFFGVPIFSGICVAGCVTIVEALSPRGSDNFSIPVVAVILLVLFG